MSKAQLLNEQLSQFTKTGDKLYRPAGSTEKTLEPAIYNIGADMRGLFFEKTVVQTDQLLPIASSRYKYINEEIDKFWEAKAKFTEMGFTDKRAFILESVPGVGKSCLLKMIENRHVERGNVVFHATNLHLLSEALHEYREVEPERKVLVILEELDELLYTGSKALSDLMDGPTSVGGVFYLATTNYIQQIPERMKRPSRFDRVIEMGMPSEEDRLEYLKAKLGLNEEEDKIKDYAKKTEGFTFAHLKEFLVSVCCLGNTVDETVERLKSMTPEDARKGRYYESFDKEFPEMLKKVAESNRVSASDLLKLLD